MTRPATGPATVVVVAVGLSLALAATARVPGAGAGWRLAFVAVHLGASAALVAFVRRRQRGGGLSTRAFWVGAVAFRLCLLPLLPTLSDDGYRYIWDGGASAAGESPYQFRPSDPALAGESGGEVFERMNSPDYYSVYPPASQAGFALAVWLAPGDGWRAAWWTWKGLLVAVELAAIAALLRLVRPEAAALYAWSPLAVVEVAGQGHTEALVIGGLALVLGVTGGRVPWRSVGATVAGAVKLYPFALLPQAWRREGWRGAAATAVVLVTLAVPFWTPDAADHVGQSLALFFGTFDEYAAPYRLLKAALYPVAGADAGRAASLALAAVFAGAAAWCGLADDGTRRTLVGSVIGVVFGFALTATTLHPWYWLPVLFMLPLLQNKHQKPLLWLTGWASATYLAYTVPSAALAVTVVGWGGAVVLMWRGYASGQGVTRPSAESASAASASSHSASG